MKSLRWDPSFATGLEPIDSQHRHLVTLTNRLAATPADEAGRAGWLEARFAELKDYAGVHFDAEESLMRECGLGGAHREAHELHHREFHDQLATLWKARADIPDCAGALHGFLCGWIAQHLLGEDRVLASHVAAQRGGSPAPAGEEASARTGAMRQAVGDFLGVLAAQARQIASAHKRLGTRGKELGCLSGVAGLAAHPDKSIFEVLREAVPLLPPAWYHAEVAEARIVHDGNTFATPSFRETPWLLRADLVVSGVAAGRVEVAYRDERPVLDEGPFLREERLLIDLVAARLSAMIENKSDERLVRSLLDVFSLSGFLDEGALLQRGLDIAQDLTHSRIAFLHFVSEDQREMELAAWSREALPPPCAEAPERRVPVERAGVWADCVRLRHAVLVNDPQAAGRADGPRGGAPLERLASVPVFEGGRVRMVIGVGNADFDYGEQVSTRIGLLANALYRIVKRMRSDSALRDSERLLADMAGLGQIGGWELERETGLIQWTDEVYRILEAERDYNPTRDAIAEFLSADMRARLEQAFEKAFRDGQSFEMDVAVMTTRGTERTLVVTGRPDGARRRIRGLVKDVTGRPRTARTGEKPDDWLQFTQAGTDEGGTEASANRLLQGMSARYRARR